MQSGEWQAVPRPVQFAVGAATPPLGQPCLVYGAQRAVGAYGPRQAAPPQTATVVAPPPVQLAYPTMAAPPLAASASAQVLRPASPVRMAQRIPSTTNPWEFGAASPGQVACSWDFHSHSPSFVHVAPNHASVAVPVLNRSQSPQRPTSPTPLREPRLSEPAPAPAPAPKEPAKRDTSPTSPSRSVGWVTDGVVKNDAPIQPPTEPTLMDNTQLFLPKAAVLELGLEPNMDDKGDDTKTLWFGRVWELRALIAIRYARRLARLKREPLSAQRKAELYNAIADPVTGKLLTKMAARWKGAAFRLRSGLSVLEKLEYCGLRGTLIYCHGSGGNSWDNMRICRMIAKLGVLVVVPDGFAYPKDTPMGKMRHKDLQPLKKATDDVDYWTGDLIYCSDASGEMAYSTKAEGVLADPDKFRDLYERCYQLRRSELHFIIERLPHFIEVQGIFLGGTSEGAMTIARFDDQRYGSMILGRFINSFSIEYCYFTPRPEDGRLGGQPDVPTLNIIGTKDQFFGPVDSVAKIVVSDEKTGYGDKVLDGNGYPCLVEQRVSCGLVCIFEDGVHSPCETHDNFLHALFDVFFRRPHDIWRLDHIWGWEPMLKDLFVVAQQNLTAASRVTQVFCPRMKFPQKMSFRRMKEMSRVKGFNQKISELKAEEDRKIEAERRQNEQMLDQVRRGRHMQPMARGPDGARAKLTKKPSYYDSADKYTKTLSKAKATQGASAPLNPFR